MFESTQFKQALVISAIAITAVAALGFFIFSPHFALLAGVCSLKAQIGAYSGVVVLSALVNTYGCSKLCNTFNVYEKVSLDDLKRAANTPKTIYSNWYQVDWIRRYMELVDISQGEHPELVKVLAYVKNERYHYFPKALLLKVANQLPFTEVVKTELPVLIRLKAEKCPQEVRAWIEQYLGDHNMETGEHPVLVEVLRHMPKEALQPLLCELNQQLPIKIIQQCVELMRLHLSQQKEEGVITTDQDPEELFHTEVTSQTTDYERELAREIGVRGTGVQDIDHVTQFKINGKLITAEAIVNPSDDPQAGPEALKKEIRKALKEQGKTEEEIAALMPQILSLFTVGAAARIIKFQGEALKINMDGPVQLSRRAARGATVFSLDATKPTNRFDQERTVVRIEQRQNIIATGLDGNLYALGVVKGEMRVDLAGKTAKLSCQVEEVLASPQRIS